MGLPGALRSLSCSRAELEFEILALCRQLEIVTADTISVADHVLRRCALGERLNDLLCGPFRRGSS